MAQKAGSGVFLVDFSDKTSVSAIELFTSTFSVNRPRDIGSQVLWRCFCLVQYMQAGVSWDGIAENVSRFPRHSGVISRLVL